MIEIDVNGKQGIHFIVGPYFIEHPSLKCNLYKVSRKCAEDYANKINKELAEGPTVFYPHNYYGPVELWPLVYEGD